MSKTLSSITSAEIVLKFENLQLTAAFKERGALSELSSLTDEKRIKDVFAMSGGNHAQAVAYHAQWLEISATIVRLRMCTFNRLKSNLYCRQEGWITYKKYLVLSMKEGIRHRYTM